MAENVSYIKQLFDQLNTSEAAAAREKALLKSVKSKKKGLAQFEAMHAKPLSMEAPQKGAAFDSTALSNTLGNLGAVAKAHPLQTLGTVANAGGNIAGLTDNDKWLGQALGTAGGVLLSKAVPGLGALGTLNMAMGGGNIGALFDSLAAKREEEKRQQNYVNAAQYT